MNFEPTKQNLKAWKGATFRKRWVLHQGDETTPVQNVTGWTASFKIYDKKGGTVLLTPTVTVGGVAGYFEVVILQATLSSQTWTNGVYELLVTDTTPDVSAFLYGGFTIWGIETP